MIILTIITVAVSRVDLGVLNTPVALLVAIIKASLVGAFFMGLRWEKVNLIFVFGAIAAMVLFFLFTFVDIAYRGAISPDVQRAHSFDRPLEYSTSGKVEKYYPKFVQDMVHDAKNKHSHTEDNH